MKRWQTIAAMAAVALCLGGCGGKPESKSKSETAAPLKIAVIPKGTTHEFWKSVHAGAVQAEREIGGIKVEWKGPQKEDDREAQITVVEDFIAKGVKGIVLAPLDNEALIQPVKDAAARGIPVVVIDSALNGTTHRSYVATDNYQGGVMAAKHMGQIVNGKARLIMMRYQEGSASTMQREAGFIETIRRDFADITVLSDNQYAGATAETAMQTAENLLVRFPDADAVFCPNESSTFGMLKALQAAKRAGTVKFVGFDTSKPLVDALRAGEIHGLVAQNPMKMGYLGVATMVKVLKDEPVPAAIDTGAVLVTPANIGEQAIVDLINPPLDKYLK